MLNLLPVPSSVRRRRWTTWCWTETTSCLQLAEPSCATTTRPSSPSSPSSDTWRWTSLSLTPLCRSGSLQSRYLLFTCSTKRICDEIICLCLQGTAASTKNKLPTLITSMETIGAKALEEFADSIKATRSHFNPSLINIQEWLLAEFSLVWLQNDPDKEYNMPKDGTVHELTSNVSSHTHFCYVTHVFALSALQSQHLPTRTPLFVRLWGSRWSPWERPTAFNQ